VKKRSDTDEILRHLAMHGTIDKDALQTRPMPRKKLFETRRKGSRRSTLDLHGRTAEESVRLIREAFDLCEDHAVQELLVIHGKGRHSPRGEGPVLKKLFFDMMENELALRVRELRTALPREGGEGATLVILRH
jgi:DNA-nicking Smr family endonuclease